MKIAVDLGHGVSYDRGASGFVSEEQIVREYGSLLINKLVANGYSVLNVTPQSANSLLDSLSQRTNAANSFGANLFVSCHVNSFSNSQAQGCETEYISGYGKIYAQYITDSIASLGFVNRGITYRPDLYVLKHSTMAAVLIEPFFCSSIDDCKKYNGNSLADAIVKGIMLADGKNSGSTVIISNKSDWVYRLQSELNKQFGAGLVLDGIPGPKTLAACITVKQGAVGNITKLIQEKLISLGYNTNGLDGIFGSGTLNAIMKFQTSKGLVADGIVGQNTWKALLGI